MNDDRESAPARPASNGRPRSWALAIVGVLAVVGVLVAIGVSGSTSTASAPVPYSTFLQRVSSGLVTSVTVHQPSGKLDVTWKDGTTAEVQGPPDGMPDSDVALLDSNKVARSYHKDKSSSLTGLTAFIFPVVLVLGLWIMLSRTGSKQMRGAASFSKSTAKVNLTSTASTAFADIAGYQGVKEEISEIVDFLTDPARFKAIGARVPKGVLLVGPPGTGKTLFARAVAGEAGVAFLSITGSEFMELYVGVGAARVRDLFRQAREHHPSIIFVDEIDAIGRKRGTGIGGGHDEREQTLNQLLAEMDGFEVTEGIMLLAATNRPDVLDPALLRAGRFDRQVVIPLPTLEERAAILAVHARGKQLEEGVDLDVMARATPGMSGAELANLVNEAALIAVRRGAERISAADLEAAHDRILIGMQRTSLALSAGEKRIVAYHEAGHALLGDVLEASDPVVKISILPTGMALGVTQQLPEVERMLEQREYLDDALAVRLGGRAAEELVFGTVSTGAHDDLVAATGLARKMVREWGMSKAFPHMAWGTEGPVFLGEDLVHTRDYSDETARIIDQEIERILDEQAVRAHDVLTLWRPALDRLAAALIERETLEGREVEAIINDTTAERERCPSLQA
jgi:cell division protease FtsH